LIWNDHIGAPKTRRVEADVLVIPLPKEDGGFQRVKMVGFFVVRIPRPLDLDSLSRREIPKFIDGAWFGWHAFRRGLGKRLNETGVNDKDIQSILRHADVSATQAFYILSSRERAEAGLKKLGRTLRTKYGIKG
jgi:hypothetical protein